jgi:hypothetical protein
LQYQRQVETVAVAVITFMVGAMFLSATFSPMVMLLTALGIALRTVPQAARFVGRARPGRSSRRGARAVPTAVPAGMATGG